MKHSNRILLFLAATGLAMLAYSSNVRAQAALVISYQGALENNGTPASGSQSMEFRIYSAATGGSALWTETQTVQVQNGIFNVLLGSVQPLEPTLDFKKPYYLSVAVGGSAELTPRAPLSFAPYAFHALNADTASYAQHATTISGGFVTSVDGFNGPLTLSGTNGISITNAPGTITIGNNGVQSVNTAGGKVTLVGTGGTTITDTGTTITIHSATFTGGTGIQAVQNSDSSITITNGSGPITTISLGKQGADTGQVLTWNGVAWKPATIAQLSGSDSIKNLQDARDDGSSVYLGAGSGVNNSGKNSNTAVGIESLHSNTSGSNNSGFGDSTLFANTTGSGNIALGTSSLARNTTGYSNIAIGYQSLRSNTGGYGNLAIGNQALKFNSNTSGEIAIGSQALYDDTAGSDNIAIGTDALSGNRDGGGNVAIGEIGLTDNTSGNFNISIGFDVLNNNTIGANNEAIGHYALGWNHIDSFLVAIGDSALVNDGWSFTQQSIATLDSGTANTAVGSKALARTSTGAYNTGMGYHVLFSNFTGYRNTALGYLALFQNSNGSDNTAIGSSAGPTSSNLNNTTALGSGAQASASNQVVLGNGNVTSLYCQGAYAATTANSANLVVLSTGQIARSTSSARYKTNIHDLDINTGLLYDLRPVSYTSKIDGKEYFGLVAEDVAQVLPELAEYARARDVIPGSTSDALIPDAVKYPMLSVLLLEELKKEHSQVEAQKQINADLERRLEVLEAAQRTTR